MHLTALPDSLLDALYVPACLLDLVDSRLDFRALQTLYCLVAIFL